jgi:hypothetical protein
MFLACHASSSSVTLDCLPGLALASTAFCPPQTERGGNVRRRLRFTYRLYGLLAHRLPGFMAVRAAIGGTFAFHADMMPEKVALLCEKLLTFAQIKSHSLIEERASGHDSTFRNLGSTNALRLRGIAK